MIKDDLLQKYCKLIEDIQSNYKSIKPVLHRVSAFIQTIIDKNFSQQGRWDGNTKDIGLFSGGTQKWHPLAESTKKIYQRLGYSLDPTLRRSGHMYNSIDIYPKGESSIILSSNSEYGAIHNFGGTINIPSRTQTNKHKLNIKGQPVFAKKSAVGKKITEKNVIIPAYKITIPARPFLTLTDEDLIEILEELKKYAIEELE